jgi:predicted enzyme related to lactoylglutathione lyase
MAKSIKLLVYPVKDIGKAKIFYSKFLGVEPYVESPYYVGYRVGDLEVGLDPNSKIGPISYTDVIDIRASLKEMTDKGGAEIVQDIKDVANGLLIAQVKDTNGNVVGLRQQS